MAAPRLHQQVTQPLIRRHLRRVWLFFFLAGAGTALAAVGSVAPGFTLQRGGEVLLLVVASACMLIVGFDV